MEISPEALESTPEAGANGAATPPERSARTRGSGHYKHSRGKSSARDKISFGGEDGLPALDSPAVDSPALETPALETPALETPAVDSPALETPALETPARDRSAPEKPQSAEATAPTVEQDQLAPPLDHRQPAPLDDQESVRDPDGGAAVVEPARDTVADEDAWDAWVSASEPTEDRLEQLDADLAKSPHRLSRWADAAATGKRSYYQA